MAELNDVLDTLRGRLPGIEDLGPLAGGASSLTYAGRMSDRRVVVKVAPVGLAPVRHRDVLRQARILKALHGSPVPVPEVLCEDLGDPPEVPPLFVMSWTEGCSVEPLYDLDDAGRSPSVGGRFHNAAAVMAELHRIAPANIGLQDEPVASTEAEIDRWRAALATVDPSLAPGWEQVAAALQAAVPAPIPPALVHGDFRLGNLLAVDDVITGVIDWEIWSIGDPRIDAGWFLINSDPNTYRRTTPYVGMTPSPAALASTYSAALGYPVPDLDWFQALACFKSAATWSLIVKHNRRRQRPDPVVEAVSDALPHLLSRACDHLGRRV